MLGLAITPRAKSTLISWHPVSSRLLTAEFLTQMGPLAAIVVYAPTENSDPLEKDTFYEDLEEIMMRMNNLVFVIGDFNAHIGTQLSGIVVPNLLATSNSDDGERLITFASTHNMNITNTMFAHKRIHQGTWYPPNTKAEPSMKDYILVKRRLISSILDTRVYREADINSDHRLVISKVKLKSKKKTPDHKKKIDRDFKKKINQDFFKNATIREQYKSNTWAIQEILIVSLHARYQETNFEDKWKDFSSTIRSAAGKG